MVASDPAGAPPVDAARLPRPPRSGRRIWLFRLVAIMLGLLPFALLEAGLRLAGVGHRSELVIPVDGAAGWYQFNPAFDRQFYGLADLSGPEPRPFQLPKPANVRRILVVGGSTVVGFPYASELAFPRVLELLLQEQAADGERIEVLNAGITAINSSTEVAVVEQGLAAAPDLIVIYSGHNEFYGPGGVASSAGSFSPWWFRTLAACRTLRLMQLAQRWTQSTPSDAGLLSTLPADLHITEDSATFQSAVSRFSDNLRAMVRAARSARTPVVLVTPVANEHHQPPVEPLSSSLAAGWVERLVAAERELQWADPAKALAALETLEREAPRQSRVLFRLAQALEKAGRASEALIRYRQALDADGCRFRAPSAFRKTLLEVAAEFPPDQVTALDLHPVLSAADPDGLPGRRHFLEHVHFTWTGNFEFGRALAETVSRDVWQRGLSAERMSDEQNAADRIGLQTEDHLAALALTMFVYQKPPFRDGPDAERIASDLAADSLPLYRALDRDRQQLFAELPIAAMYPDLAQNVIAAARQTGRNSAAEVWLEAAVRRQPWRQDWRRELAEWLRQHNRHAEAAALEGVTSGPPSDDSR